MKKPYPIEYLDPVKHQLPAPKKPATPEEREQIFAAICETIRRHGSTVHEAASLAEIEWSELLEWKEQNPDYAFRLAYAGAQYRRNGLQAIRQAKKRNGHGNWRRFTWLFNQSRAHEKQEWTLAHTKKSRPVTIDDTLTPENVADLNRRWEAARAADAPNIERMKKAAAERAASAAATGASTSPPNPAEPAPPAPPGALDGFALAHLRAHNLTLPPSAFR